MLVSAGVLVFFSAALCTYERVVTIQYYHNANPNNKKITKCGLRNSNITTLKAKHRKRRRSAGAIVGLEFLDAAMCINQYSEHASTSQHGVGPEHGFRYQNWHLEIRMRSYEHFPLDRNMRIHV